MVGATVFICACGPRGSEDSGFSTTYAGDEADEGETLGQDGDATSEGADSTAADTGADGGESSGTKFDIGDGQTDGDQAEGNPEGGDEVCSKVDVVLAVDASSSMAAEIATLPETFVLMKDTLATKVGNGITDFRIAVINACPKPAFFHNYAAGDTDCKFPAGRNWLASDDPKIDEQFACVVDIPLQNEALDEKGGNNGGFDSKPDQCSDSDDEDEQPAWTAAQAVQPGIPQNSNFLRPDAIVFVVAITDEDEAFASVGDGQEIRDALISAKNGVDNNVTFLGIGGEDCQSAYDGDDVKDSDNLRETAEAFGERGLFRSMCEEQGPDPIAAAFEEALTTIVDAACDEYVPVG